jgi:nitroreductase
MDVVNNAILMVRVAPLGLVWMSIHYHLNKASNALAQFLSPQSLYLVLIIQYVCLGYLPPPPPHPTPPPKKNASGSRLQLVF